jgi:4'-phosphopantetheinyl transferase
MIDVYVVRLDFRKKLESNIFDQLLTCVAPEKSERLLRFYWEEDKLRGLFGDLLIRDLIRQKTGLHSQEISFSTNEYGKPLLKNYDHVHFNLSHSGVWVGGVIDNQPVGIDVEQVQSIDLGISENYFSPDEHEDLMSKVDKFDYFFTLWALKESYIKILGKGLSHPLNAFSIKFIDIDEIIIKVEGKRIHDIFFRQYHIDKEYKMAVCAAHDLIPRDVHMVTPGQLIKRFIPGYNGKYSDY